MQVHADWSSKDNAIESLTKVLSGESPKRSNILQLYVGSFSAIRELFAPSTRVQGKEVMMA